jgi:hypothetical protein
MTETMEETRRPARILLLATGRWVSTARLALTLKSFGCRLELVALKGHPARLSGLFERIGVYHPLSPLESVRAALRGAFASEGCDAVIPVDELALMHLKELAETSVEVRRLVERSLGGDLVLEAASSRMRLLELAKEESVPIPATVQWNGEGDLTVAIDRLGLPIVLKADATSGGRGVRVAHHPGEARREWRLLANPPSLARALKRGLTAGDWTHLRPWWRRTHTGVTAQQFISGGRERTGMAVCAKGRVVSCVCLEVLESWCERGPSSLVKVIDDPSMERAMHAVAAKTGVTGFCGFDFMVDGPSGTALLIEMNPRPTQLVHLPLGPGRDLIAAYVREVLHRPAEDRARLAGEIIALFPLALERGPIRADAFHDVPWNAPELVKRVLKPVPDEISSDPRWQGGK